MNRLEIIQYLTNKLIERDKEVVELKLKIESLEKNNVELDISVYTDPNNVTLEVGRESVEKQELNLDSTIKDREI